MATTLDEQINQLKQAIDEIEAQRAILGDEAVDAALVPSRQKLSKLESLVELSVEKPEELPTRQRKLVTLLYMDVVGSTAMTQHLDPEDNLEIMEKALLHLVEPIQEHGGRVTRYTGDGFKAIFGDPSAMENDPEQAIRAGLKILDVSKVIAQEIEKEWGIEDFQVRIGIDTGLAAIGGQTEAEDTVKGRVVNLAVRIESAAPPGGLLISHNTYRHVRGVFTVEPQEPITAKGFPEPIPVYLVESIKPRAFRVLTRGVEGVETRMVGRQDELKYLQDALLTVIEEREGQVVTISGEAGVGKSRLLYEYQNWFELLPPNVRLFQGKGRQESQGQPYSLLRDLFAFRFQILEDDIGVHARQKIEAGFCEVFGEDNDDIMRAHILGQLLGFDFSASPHLKGVLGDAEQLRNRALMYLVQYYQALCEEGPVLILLEDIHWADDSSLDVVMRLGEHTPQLRLLIVGAARPTLFERRPYWGEGQIYHTQLELRPLSKRDSRQLVTEILKMANEIPNELRELVVGGSEGNPFYLEELIKMLIEDTVVVPGEETWGIDMARLEKVDVPSTLAGVLQARLDSLPMHERTVLQQASVVGRLFWDRIVTYIQAEGENGGDPQLIPQALTSLRDRELVYRHEESAFVGSAEYLFKHDVLREVTYESVIKRLRRTYHGMVADWLIANSGDRIGEYSGLIADHLQLSGRKDLAGEYFMRAGDSALASFANTEAEKYYRQAMKFTTSAASRGSILSGLGEALRLQVRVEDASRVLRESIDLYQEIGDFDQIGQAYARLSLLYHFNDDLKAWTFCQEGLELLSGSENSQGYARLLSEAGNIAWSLELDEEALILCQQAIKMADQLGEINISSDAMITLAFLENEVLDSISILKEVVAISEANSLLDLAARAHHNLGYFHGQYLINLDKAIMHSIFSAEIRTKIGDLDGTIIPYSNAYESIIYMGELSKASQLYNNIYSGTIAPGSFKDYYRRVYNAHTLLARGEWIAAVAIFRDILQDTQTKGSLQRIANRTIMLTRSMLELNRFGSLDDLTEAETWLNEILEIDIGIAKSHYLLSTVYARQGRTSEAIDLLAQPQDDMTFMGRENNRLVAWLAMAESELARAENRWGDAMEACNKAIEVFKDCGHKLWWARQLIDLGDSLIGRNDPGDLERARETYQQSLDMFIEMGAPGYIKVLEERLARL